MEVVAWTNSVLLLYTCFFSFFFLIVFFFLLHFWQIHMHIYKYLYVYIYIYIHTYLHARYKTYSIEWTCQVPLFFFISLVRLVISIPAYQKCVQPSALIKLFLRGHKNEWAYLRTQPEKQSIYLCSSTSRSSSLQARSTRMNTIRYVYVSVDAASNRTYTFIVVPYVWICWENV